MTTTEKTVTVTNTNVVNTTFTRVFWRDASDRVCAALMFRHLGHIEPYSTVTITLDSSRRIVAVAS